jgi:hypothetical protein
MFGLSALFQYTAEHRLVPMAGGNEVLTAILCKMRKQLRDRVETYLEAYFRLV